VEAWGSRGKLGGNVGTPRPEQQRQEVRFVITRLYWFRLHRTLRVVFAVLCLAGIAAPAWAQFETRATSPLLPGAFSITAGDFNNDGKLDIVVVDDNGFSVSLGLTRSAAKISCRTSPKLLKASSHAVSPGLESGLYL
jgi:hypothetical protein